MRKYILVDQLNFTGLDHLRAEANFDNGFKATVTVHLGTYAVEVTTSRSTDFGPPRHGLSKLHANFALREIAELDKDGKHDQNADM